MLHRLAIKDFAIVTELELALGPGFTVLTGETGAGKSILVDALQLALGGRGDAVVVREGAPRAEIVAEFDVPESLRTWLQDCGFDEVLDAAGAVLQLKRVIDSQGRSRAWINGSVATVGQLREAAQALVEIHGQHAWQRLTQASAVRNLLDSQAQVDTAALGEAWAAWRQAQSQLHSAKAQHDTRARERERLQWQVNELSALQPSAQAWEALNEEHRRLANAQALIDGARAALEATAEADPSADALLSRASDALQGVSANDARLAEVQATLQTAQSLLQDAVHALNSYLHHTEPDPQRLAELDAQLSAWMQMSRRWRRPPAELPTLLADWQEQLQTLDAQSDVAGLEAAEHAAQKAFLSQAQVASKQRRKAAPLLSKAVTQAMQGLGMAGGRFEVALQPQNDAPQAHGLEDMEFLMAGHPGATPRPLAKVASGGELSRLALAIAVSTAQSAQASAAADEAVGTLIFDEVDSGIGGQVADVVGRQMKALGQHSQVLAVTHLAQVAACADAHHVVAKHSSARGSHSQVQLVQGESRVAEVARMLGGESLSGTAHARAMLQDFSR